MPIVPPKLTDGEAEGATWSDWAQQVTDNVNTGGGGEPAGLSDATRTALAATYATQDQSIINALVFGG